jgi:hypothetical protein
MTAYKLKKALKQAVNACIVAKEEFDAAKIKLDEHKEIVSRLFSDNGLIRQTTDKGICELVTRNSYSVDAADVIELSKVLKQHGLDPDKEIVIKTNYGVTAKLRGYLGDDSVLSAQLNKLIQIKPSASLSVEPNV